jgi:hypothetical protein
MGDARVKGKERPVGDTGQRRHSLSGPANQHFPHPPIPISLHCFLSPSRSFLHVRYSNTAVRYSKYLYLLTKPATSTTVSKPSFLPSPQHRKLPWNSVQWNCIVRVDTALRYDTVHVPYWYKYRHHHASSGRIRSVLVQYRRHGEMGAAVCLSLFVRKNPFSTN